MWVGCVGGGGGGCVSVSEHVSVLVVLSWESGRRRGAHPAAPCTLLIHTSIHHPHIPVSHAQQSAGRHHSTLVS